MFAKSVVFSLSMLLANAPIAMAQDELALPTIKITRPNVREFIGIKDEDLVKAAGLEHFVVQIQHEPTSTQNIKAEVASKAVEAPTKKSEPVAAVDASSTKPASEARVETTKPAAPATKETAETKPTIVAETPAASPSPTASPVAELTQAQKDEKLEAQIRAAIDNCEDCNRNGNLVSFLEQAAGIVDKDLRERLIYDIKALQLENELKWVAELKSDLSKSTEEKIDSLVTKYNRHFRKALALTRKYPQHKARIELEVAKACTKIANKYMSLAENKSSTEKDEADEFGDLMIGAMASVDEDRMGVEAFASAKSLLEDCDEFEFVNSRARSRVKSALKNIDQRKLYHLASFGPNPLLFAEGYKVMREARVRAARVCGRLSMSSQLACQAALQDGIGAQQAMLHSYEVQKQGREIQEQFRAAFSAKNITLGTAAAEPAKFPSVKDSSLFPGGIVPTTTQPTATNPLVTPITPGTLSFSLPQA